MAIPPIFSNLPILKLFKSDTSSVESQEKGDAPAARDKVEISEAAQERLSAEEIEQAVATATQTRDLLGDDQDATLGLGPDFSV